MVSTHRLRLAAILLLLICLILLTWAVGCASKNSSTASGAVKQAFDAAISGDLSGFAKNVAPDNQKYASDWSWVFDRSSSDLSDCRGVKYQVLERSSRLSEIEVTLVLDRPCGYYNDGGEARKVGKIDAFLEKVNSAYYLLPIGGYFFHLHS